MARISLIEPENAAPEVKEIYEQKLRGKPGNAQKAMAHRPEALKNFLSFYASVGRSLDRKLYELIYIRVSLINQCGYCLQHHLASSKRVGLTAEDWEGLKQGSYATGQRKRAGGAGLRRKADAEFAQRQRCRLHPFEKTFHRRRDRGSAPARGLGQPHQPVHRPAGTRAGVSRRAALNPAQTSPRKSIRVIFRGVARPVAAQAGSGGLQVGLVKE